MPQSLEEKRRKKAEQSRRWRERNPERALELRLKYEAKNRDKIKARQKQWAEDHPGYQTEYFRKNYSDPSYRMRYMVQRAGQRCRQSGLEFDPDIAGVLASNPPTHCACCGIEFDYATVYDRGFRQNRAPSLDRVDNARGYTLDNVAVICTRCNLIKSDATPEELETVAAYARRNLPPRLRLVG